MMEKNAAGDKKATTQAPVTNQPPITSQATNDLGLLTTSTIAEGLKMSEGEVINLITTEQLKGKKIGDKYFVRKEDFDEFMKR